MVYQPPVGNNINFDIDEYTPPTGNNVNFDLSTNNNLASSTSKALAPTINYGCVISAKKSRSISEILSADIRINAIIQAMESTSISNGLILEIGYDKILVAQKATSISSALPVTLEEINILIEAETSISFSNGLSPIISCGYKIKPEAANSISKALISNITYDYAVQVSKSVSISESSSVGLSLSVLEIILERADSSSTTPVAAVKSNKRVIIQAAISKSNTTAPRPSLSIQGNLLFSADTAQNKARVPIANINIGYPAIVEAEISTSKSIGLSPTICFNLLDYISCGDDIYLLVSDRNNNAKIYRGIVRDRVPSDRLLTISAITGDGILSERIIREDYDSQDIGLTAKEIINTYCNPLTSSNINVSTGIEAPITADQKTPLSVLENMRREYGINYYVDHTWDVHLFLVNEIEDSNYEEKGYIIKLGDE